MIITKAPLRISFFGGGTDYKPFFEEYGGSVISSTFDKYVYVTARHLPRFFDYKNQITYAKIEQTNSVEEIQHPSVREAMKMLDMNELRVVYEADIPARSGVGSSSSFAVAMLQSFHALKGHFVSKQQLAQEAIYLERELCKESGGWQDQIAASFGGLNRINFTSDGFSVKPIVISKERKTLLNEHLMLFFTGFQRNSSDIAAEQVKTLKDKITELKELKDLTEEGEKILTSKCDLSAFGELLRIGWELKRGLSDKISNNAIDDIYQKAMKNGALGGKLLGAGGGGFILLFVPPQRQEKMRAELKDFLHVPFTFENTGSSILYYDPEDYTQQETIK